MRPEHEWFKPEKLTGYFFVFEAMALALVLAVAGMLAYAGVLWELQEWVVLAGGAVLLAVFGFVTWWIPAFYRSAEYRLTGNEIDYRRGVFFQHKSTVPYNRITNVDAVQGPIQCLVGAGKVSIHTAGYAGQTGAELSIDGVADFEAVTDQILNKVRQRPPGATGGGETTVETPAGTDGEPPANELLVELCRIRDLLERELTA